MFRLDVLRSPERRGLKGLKLVISDAHEGPKAQHQMVAAAIRTLFMPADHATASVVRSQVADQLRARLPKSAAPMDEAEADAIPSCLSRVIRHPFDPFGMRMAASLRRRAGW